MIVVEKWDSRRQREGKKFGVNVIVYPWHESHLITHNTIDHNWFLSGMFDEQLLNQYNDTKPSASKTAIISCVTGK